MSQPPSSPAEHPSPAHRKLRIAVFNRTFSPTGGGAERYSIALVEQLSARHEIHVFAQEIDHHWPGVTYHRVSAPLRKPRWINQLWFATATWWGTRRGFDVVHSHENTWHGDIQTVHVLPVKYNLFHGRTGWRLMLRWIKVVTSPRLLAYLVIERFRFTLRGQRQIVATSPALKEVLEHTYPACASVLSVISPGVVVPAAGSDRLAARRSLGLPAHGPLIAFVANDYQKKGLGTLLDALKRLPSDVALAVVGNPSYIERFRQKAVALAVSERVHFLGHLRDVSPLYQAADILAHPTLEDTFAMVVLEAMAYGLPIVVSDSRYCGIAGLLTDGVNALILSSPTDARQLSDRLARILQEPALYRDLATGARDFASQWSWSTIACQQEVMYRDIADAASRTAPHFNHSH
ncbi:MAG TPA: glycosyltransferase family 1 protein [Polaromonas sp.]|uniref:glycosyltransferase family 4 protein n=1 Tax=Polaromonas sp. UBA4122 TaxID=1947074 RepID=UPI000EC2071E|nr:glycosyltransferase family 4 protein [Polaromonas sp. UBA4122]HAL40155.1 glycosyltransferase family 1 protein [Polaromonas sp.]